jgi:hypothetical protein
MTPLEITMLLRLHCRADPFDGMPWQEKVAPAMDDAFKGFIARGLLADGVGFHEVYFAEAPGQYLSEKGQQLVKRLCEVQP